MPPITFCITHYAHPELLDVCLDSIRKYYPREYIIVSQEEGDVPIQSPERVTQIIQHNMKTKPWVDAAIGLLEHCDTDIAVFMEHDCFLLKPIDHLINLVANGTYDLIGPEEVIPLPGLNRNSPGFVCQNFFIINVKKMKEIGLEKARLDHSIPRPEIKNEESGYGISQQLEKKLFLPVTASKYACGTYYSDIVHHLWYGSYRQRNTLSDGIPQDWMEEEALALIDDYWNDSLRSKGICLPSSDNKQKYAVCILAHREAECIGECIQSWEGIVDKILVLVSSKAWNGQSNKDDGTVAIANNTNAEVVLSEWKTEAEQRNWGLARLYDYDYVLIVDADEFYTREDQLKILDALNHPIHLDYTPDRSRHVPAFRCANMITYWKNLDYVFSPADTHKPIIAVDPKQVYCYEHRQFKFPFHENSYIDYSPLIDITCHHLSYSKTDEKIKEKIASFSHADSIKPNWYEDVWLKWQPDSNMEVRPYGVEKSVAIYQPAPQEIRNLFDKHAV